MEILDMIGQILGTDNSIYIWLVAAFSAVTGVVGGATLVVDGLERIAKVTPYDKDDQYVGKAKRFLGKVADFLDKLAMNKRNG